VKQNVAGNNTNQSLNVITKKKKKKSKKGLIFIWFEGINFFFFFCIYGQSFITTPADFTFCFQINGKRCFSIQL